MQGKTGERSESAWFTRPTMFDVGIGVLYFFTSHMVIRALFYVGLDRGPRELALFFFIVIAAIILAHGFASPLLRGRLLVETSFGVPAVSVTAAVGAVAALVSVLPVVGPELFYLSGALLGLACGWIVVIWSSTIRVGRPDSSSFFLDPALVVAVVVYFLFRCVSSLSEAVAQGFLLALPLVALACIVRSDRGAGENGTSSLMSERARSLETLVVVAAAFAVGCSLVVYLSGRESEMLSSGLNYMVLFEVLAVVLIAGCCALLRAFSQRCAGYGKRTVAAVTLVLCYGPALVVGLVMGGAIIPSHAPDAMWESNMWVLVIAIFAYDIRDSPYAVCGLAVGLMFEAMCVGQLIARAAALEWAPEPVATGLAIALLALYLLCVGNQLLRGTTWQDARALDSAADSANNSAGDVDVTAAADRPCDGELGSPSASAPSDEEGVPADIALYCQELAGAYGLTPREAEILALMALGRSAKYISEELQVSYNTTRTHARHIYEKLNIHSKQELIDLVLFGSGVM